MSLGTRLRNLRQQKNLSQMQVAQELEVSQTAYNKWESDLRKPGIENLVKLSEFYNVDIYELLYELLGENTIFNSNFSENTGVIGHSTVNHYFSEKLIEQYEARIISLQEQLEYWKNKNE